ncbi:uncharacterized protein [Spinacia oleracea]|uniref:Aspartic peptidase DDI1-type domain-containing protein n=1 Tax=Spinacia oleracea TaxID=3562 RepID=A0ABM3RIJ7_SPIOL|nr:uncharacterized protein LOC110796554 [Spinacia oleracea]
MLILDTPPTSASHSEEKLPTGVVDKDTSNSCSKPPPPPPHTSIVNFIAGGSDVCGLIYSAAKQHARENGTDKSARAAAAENVTSIFFDESDVENISSRHHDGLVISIPVGNCMVRRVLVDNGSSTNVMVLEALKEMGLNPEKDVIKKSAVLIGFSGETKITFREVTLPVYAQRINQQVKFCVINCPSSYNIILGRPCIHDMKAIPLTYHQTIKFQTRCGVQEIKGD